MILKVLIVLIFLAIMSPIPIVAFFSDSVDDPISIETAIWCGVSGIVFAICAFPFLFSTPESRVIREGFLVFECHCENCRRRRNSQLRL